MIFKNVPFLKGVHTLRTGSLLEPFRICRSLFSVSLLWGPYFLLRNLSCFRNSENATHYTVSSSILGLVWKHTVSLHQLLGKPEILKAILNNSRRFEQLKGTFTLLCVEHTCLPTSQGHNCPYHSQCLPQY